MAWDRQWVLQLSMSMSMSLVQGLNQEYRCWSEMDVFVSCTCQISSKVASYCEQWKVVIDARRFKVDESKKFLITSAPLSSLSPRHRRLTIAILPVSSVNCIASKSAHQCETLKQRLTSILSIPEALPSILRGFCI